MRLSVPRPPLRAVIAIAVGWAGVRAWLLWSGDEVQVAQHAPQFVRAAAPVAFTPNAPARVAINETVPGKANRLPAASESQLPLVREESGLPPPLPVADSFLEPHPPLPASEPSPRATPHATEAVSADRSRWSGWAYIFARPGGGRTLAAGGQLGGSQIAARLSYRPTERFAAFVRAYAPLRGEGAEAAVGADIAVSGPVHAIVERRIGIGHVGRDAWSAYLTTGAYRERGPLIADAYLQAGVVGARRQDGFVDGAARAGVRLGTKAPIIGAGLWGAAQPGAVRVDVGPRVSWTVPGTGLAASVEGRFRIAGQARPGSGVALTLARDF